MPWNRIRTKKSNSPYTLQKWRHLGGVLEAPIEKKNMFVFHYIVTKRGFVIFELVVLFLLVCLFVCLFDCLFVCFVGIHKVTLSLGLEQ